MGKRIFNRIVALAAVLLAAGPVLAQDGASTAPLPRSMASPFRIAPVIGASSFATDNELQLDEFDNNGFSGGIFADFGGGTFSFETGILALGGRAVTGEQAAAVDVTSWGVPLLGKVNFSGQPHSTIFLKAGGMPCQCSGGADEFDIMGVGGLGAAIPLGRSSSLLLDASYNRLFGDSGEVTDYQGVSLLAGLQLNI